MWCVLSVFDSKACQYDSIFLARTKEVGARMFSDTILGKELTLLRAHPEDYSLHQVGSFDEEVGVLIPLDAVLVVTAEQCLRNAARVVNPGGANGSEL